MAEPTLSQRLSDLTIRIAQEFNLIRQEINNIQTLDMLTDVDSNYIVSSDNLYITFINN